jgi:hypothetical protein
VATVRIRKRSRFGSQSFCSPSSVSSRAQAETSSAVRASSSHALASKEWNEMVGAGRLQVVDAILYLGVLRIASRLARFSSAWSVMNRWKR